MKRSIFLLLLGVILILLGIFFLTYRNMDCENHFFIPLKTITPATCTTEGIKRHICILCREADDRTVPMRPHKYNKAWSYDFKMHYHACTSEECNRRTDVAEHSFNSTGLCSVCAYQATSYTREGNTIYFGYYPQSEVKDTTLTARLTNLAGKLPTESNNEDWISYGYYMSREASNFMWYQDISHNGELYRGVYFVENRPLSTLSSSFMTLQESNGYLTDTVYWFKYEPIAWTILSEEDGKVLLLCNTILDAQAYQNACYSADDGIYTNSNNAPSGTHASNYAYSTIRTWLNDTFYNTAFNEMQKSIILLSTVDNSAATTANSDNPHACENTQDKIFLPSFSDATNSDYGFAPNEDGSDDARVKFPSAYAKSQGAMIHSNDTYKDGVGVWWLRSPYYTYFDAASVATFDNIGDQHVTYTCGGILPALWLQL